MADPAPPSGDDGLRLELNRQSLRLAESEARFRAQQELLANLLAVARATTELPTLEATLRSALEVVEERTGAEAAALFLASEGGALDQGLFTHADAAEAPSPHALLRELARRVAQERRSLLVEDLRDAESWRGLIGAAAGLRSALGVPISRGAGLVGVLTLAHRHPAHFRDSHLEFLQAAGEQLALALLNAQVFDSLGRMAERQSMLYEVLRAASRPLDPDAAVTAAAHSIAERSGWTNVAISVPDAGGYWRIRASSQELSPSFPQRVEGGIVGRAFRTGEVQLVKDVREDPDYIAGSDRIRSELAVPIKRGGHTDGVLNIESDTPSAFSHEDVRLAESLADAVSLALEKARLYRAVSEEGERLAALIRSSRDGLLLVAADGSLPVMNETARRLLGLAEDPGAWRARGARALAAELAGRGHPAAPVLSAAAGHAAEASTGEQGEFEDTPRSVRWASLPVLSAGESLGRLLVLRDVSEERALERAREDLTRTMVHDLRNPLTAVLGYLDLLLDRVGVPAQRDMLEAASKGARRMLGLVNAILDVSRLESGAMPLVRQRLDLAALASEVADLEAPLAREKELSLAVAVPLDLPPAWADADLLRRVLQNLLGNAVKFTPAGGAVRIAAEAAGARELRVSVSDTGPGVPASVRERLFQKFATGEQRERGSGLGLAFCKLAVEAHGGRLWLEGEPGAGAAFVLTLPVAI